MRCVPDVAAISNGNLNNVTLGGNFEPANGPDGVVIYVNGSPMSFEGTSLSCPVWAAITALVNQARAAAGTGSIGLLNPYLYPLAGTSVFNDVTSGTNGAYNAGPGYDLCSGLGTPNVTNLLAALGSPGGAAPSHRLVNLSTRADVETGANIAIAGFDISGPAGTSKDVLVRGVGPTLAGAPFNVGGTLGQPVLGVYDSSSTLIATDAGWGNAPTAGTSTSGASFRKATAADMSAVGAFALNAGSADSAMVLTLPPGTYTVQVSGAAAATGVALAEVYELSTASPEMLVNISARCFVGTGSDVAISGFVVQGSQSAQLLIRGVGPALAAFSISGPLAQPVISLFDSNNTLIVSDAGWSNNPVAGSSSSAATYRKATAADMTAAGAFGLTAGSADSAIVATLPPGSYTAQISGAGNTTGTALAEVYELPSN
jgi:septal ring-binding cell division protein DamX